MPELAAIGWYLFGGSCVLLLFGLNIISYWILRKMSWIDKYMHKWRSEEAAAINEIQGRCAHLHPGAAPIIHRLTTD